MSRATLAAIAIAIAATLPSCAPSTVAPAGVAAPTAPSSAPSPAHAAAPYAVRESPDAPFRSSAPSLGVTAEPVPPVIHTFRLANGVRVLFLEQHTLGLVRVDALLHARPAPAGANLMAAHALWLGTSSLSQMQLQAANDAEMTDMAASYAWGWVRTSMTATADHVAPMVARLSQVVLSPAFPKDQVVRITREVALEAEASDASPRSIAARVLPMALHGSALDLDSVEERSADIGALRRDDIANAYDAALDPASAALVVIGDTKEEVIRPLLERSFGGWRRRGKAAPEKRAARPSVVTSSPRIVVVDHPGTRSFVTFGGEGPVFGSADWEASLALRMFFNGRDGRAALAVKEVVNPSLEVPTLTFAPDPTAPRATLSGSFATAQTAQVLVALDRVLRASKSAAITPAEMNEARASLAVAEPFWRANLDGATDVMEGLVVQTLSPDHVATRVARLLAVTEEDAHRAAATYLDPDRMKIVVVGDWSMLRAPLQELGWGPIELRDAAGVVKKEDGAR